MCPNGLSYITSVEFEGLVDGRSTKNILFDLVISRCQLGQQLNNRSNLVLGNEDHSVDWIAKCQVAGTDESTVNVERYLNRPGYATSTDSNSGQPSSPNLHRKSRFSLPNTQRKRVYGTHR